MRSSSSTRERDIEFGMRGRGERRKPLQPCEELKSDVRERERLGREDEEREGSD